MCILFLGFYVLLDKYNIFYFLRFDIVGDIDCGFQQAKSVVSPKVNERKFLMVLPSPQNSFTHIVL